ncbi:hypothetical protein ACFL5O_00490 [Myxococcota bacterium]
MGLKRHTHGEQTTALVFASLREPGVPWYGSMLFGLHHALGVAVVVASTALGKSAVAEPPPDMNLVIDPWAAKPRPASIESPPDATLLVDPWATATRAAPRLAEESLATPTQAKTAAFVDVTLVVDPWAGAPALRPARVTPAATVPSVSPGSMTQLQPSSDRKAMAAAGVADHEPRAATNATKAKLWAGSSPGHSEQPSAGRPVVDEIVDPWQGHTPVLCKCRQSEIIDPWNGHCSSTPAPSISHSPD